MVEPCFDTLETLVLFVNRKNDPLCVWVIVPIMVSLKNPYTVLHHSV